MSTQYSMVNGKIAEQVRTLQSQVDTIKTECFEKINNLDVESELKETQSSLLDRLRSSQLFVVEEPEDIRRVIGTARAGHFQWRHENGFYDLNTVERWLMQRPEFSIVDEYGIPVTWTEFQQVVCRYN